MTTLYTATVHSTGGREGKVKSLDGILDAELNKPTEMGGNSSGVNPEMLFAAAYGACFGGALKAVAQKQGVELPEGWSIDSSVSINQEGASMFLSGRLVVKASGMDQTKLENVAKTAHIVCPYSKAVKGNMEVQIVVEV
jgi:lipoyl-dependent peroxiredoxin